MTSNLKHQGVLAALSAPELGAIAIDGALKQSALQPEMIQEAFMGNVLSANLGQAPAKQACLKAKIPESVPCTGINKVCASGMKAMMLGAQSIMLGLNSVVLVGGMESMSNVPHYLPKVRTGQKMGDVSCIDGMIRDGLWDPYDNQHMGNFAEKCATHYQITREEQDAYALQSFERAAAAAENVSREITPVTFQDKKGNKNTITADEGIGKLNKEKMKHLKPAFQSDGTVTPGNASQVQPSLGIFLDFVRRHLPVCQISDGAAALVLVSRSRAAELGIPVMASLVSMADASQHPSWFTTTPSLAIESLLQKSAIKKEDVDLFEINEAFAAVAIVNQKLLQLDPEKVNVWGGAVALGHPLGCSGARIMVTLINALKAKKKQYGIAAICNGGGGASAVLIKNEMLQS